MFRPPITFDTIAAICAKEALEKPRVISEYEKDIANLSFEEICFEIDKCFPSYKTGIFKGLETAFPLTIPAELAERDLMLARYLSDDEPYPRVDIFAALKKLQILYDCLKDNFDMIVANKVAVLPEGKDLSSDDEYIAMENIWKNVNDLHTYIYLLVSIYNIGFGLFKNFTRSDMPTAISAPAKFYASSYLTSLKEINSILGQIKLEGHIGKDDIEIAEKWLNFCYQLIRTQCKVKKWDDLLLNKEFAIPEDAFVLEDYFKEIITLPKEKLIFPLCTLYSMKFIAITLSLKEKKPEDVDHLLIEAADTYCNFIREINHGDLRPKNLDTASELLKDIIFRLKDKTQKAYFLKDTLAKILEIPDINDEIRTRVISDFKNALKSIPQSNKILADRKLKARNLILSKKVDSPAESRALSEEELIKLFDVKDEKKLTAEVKPKSKTTCKPKSKPKQPEKDRAKDRKTQLEKNIPVSKPVPRIISEGELKGFTLVERKSGNKTTKPESALLHDVTATKKAVGDISFVTPPKSDVICSITEAVTAQAVVVQKNWSLLASSAAVSSFRVLNIDEIEELFRSTNVRGMTSDLNKIFGFVKPLFPLSSSINLLGSSVRNILFRYHKLPYALSKPSDYDLEIFVDEKNIKELSIALSSHGFHENQFIKGLFTFYPSTPPNDSDPFDFPVDIKLISNEDVPDDAIPGFAIDTLKIPITTAGFLIDNHFEERDLLKLAWMSKVAWSPNYEKLVELNPKAILRALRLSFVHNFPESKYHNLIAYLDSNAEKIELLRKINFDELKSDLRKFFMRGYASDFMITDEHVKLRDAFLVILQPLFPGFCELFLAKHLSDDVKLRELILQNFAVTDSLFKNESGFGQHPNFCFVLATLLLPDYLRFKDGDFAEVFKNRCSNCLNISGSSRFIEFYEKYKDNIIEFIEKIARGLEQLAVIPIFRIK